MELHPKLNLDQYESSFVAVDTHTLGEFTRIIMSGFPKLEGNTMIEKKNFLAKHYDHLRKSLMFEPRGHHDMFGALVTDSGQSRSRLRCHLHGYRRISEYVRTRNDRNCNRSH